MFNRNFVLPSTAAASLFVFLSCAEAVAEPYPIGADDFLVSSMGGYGDAAKGSVLSVAAAYNSLRDEYLVVWSGTDSVELTAGETEVFVQRIDAATGAEIGLDDQRISDLGPAGDANFDAGFVAVAFSPDPEEFLVAFAGEDNAEGHVDGETEIYVQRLAYDVGGSLVQAGVDDQRISEMGIAGSTSYDGFSPAVAYDPNSQRYLVAWIGDHNSGGLVGDEFEVFGQLLEYQDSGASLVEVGPGDQRISEVGGTGSSDASAFFPAVAANETGGEFLVVWSGNDDGTGEASNDGEIFGQRVNAATGDPVGTSDFRISDLGPANDFRYNSERPAVAWDPERDEFLVVWTGDTDEAHGGTDDDFEVFGQRLSTAGEEIGPDDFLISNFATGGNFNLGARAVAVSSDTSRDLYWVSWRGMTTTEGAKPQVFTRRIDAQTGISLGAVQQISDQTAPGASLAQPGFLAVTDRDTDGEALTAWFSWDASAPLDSAGEQEVFGQRLRAPLFDDGFETNNMDRWSLPEP